MIPQVVKKDTRTPAQILHNASWELNAERRFGERLPLIDGLELLADYLEALQLALRRDPPLSGIDNALPYWAAFCRGIRARAVSIRREIKPR